MSTKTSNPGARRRVRRSAALTLAGALLGAGMALPASSAQATTMPGVAASGCGRIAINPHTYTGAHPFSIYFDAGFYDGSFTKASASVSEANLPGGSYSYLVYDTVTRSNISGGVVTVAACKGQRSRTVEGDANGDKVADVFGVTKAGELYYYRMTSAGLVAVKKVFASGFATTKYIQRVTEVAPSGTSSIEGHNYLFAVRTDGTLWRYPDAGNGQIGAGVQIATGLNAYSNFEITQDNSPQAFGNHMLLATKGGELYGFDGLGDSRLGTPERLSDGNGGWDDLDQQISVKAYDRNGFADSVNIWDGGDMYLDLGSYLGFTDRGQIGHGWSAMQIVASPGDVNGDGLSDLVARRADGNLYRYINTGKSWGVAVQIGQNWNGITCLG